MEMWSSVRQLKMKRLSIMTSHDRGICWTRLASRFWFSYLCAFLLLLCLLVLSSCLVLFGEIIQQCDYKKIYAQFNVCNQGNAEVC